jgi:hypothetical protein
LWRNSWTAPGTLGVRIRRTLSELKRHIEQVTCRKATAIEAEEAGELWARRWVDRHGRAM